MRAMKSLKYLIPNGFTATSMPWLGVGRLFKLGQFELAAWMILWEVLLDAGWLCSSFVECVLRIRDAIRLLLDFIIFGIAPLRSSFSG